MFLNTNLNNFPNEPGDGLKVELGDIIIDGLEEEIIVWFWKGHSGK